MYNTETIYMEIVIGKRSLKLSDEESLEGRVLVSAETTGNNEGFGLIVQEYPGIFFTHLRHLNRTFQGVLLEYYILHKTQYQIAAHHDGMTQTVCSWMLRAAEQALGAMVNFNGPPSMEVMEAILAKHQLDIHPVAHSYSDKTTDISLSEVVWLFYKWRDFEKIAFLKKVHRPALRRMMMHQSRALLEHPDRDVRFVAAWLSSLIFKSQVAGAGMKVAKNFSDTYNLKIPDVTGQFRIRLEDPDWAQVFAPQGMVAHE